MNAHCAWCRESTREPIPVGIVGQDNSAGGTIHACPICRHLNNLIPMADWKHIGDGRPQYYPAQPLSR